MNRTRNVALFFALALLVSAAAWAQFLGPVGSFQHADAKSIASARRSGHPFSPAAKSGRVRLL